MESGSEGHLRSSSVGLTSFQDEIHTFNCSVLMARHLWVDSGFHVGGDANTYKRGHQPVVDPGFPTGER